MTLFLQPLDCCYQVRFCSNMLGIDFLPLKKAEGTTWDALLHFSLKWCRISTCKSDHHRFDNFWGTGRRAVLYKRFIPLSFCSVWSFPLPRKPRDIIMCYIPSWLIVSACLRWWLTQWTRWWSCSMHLDWTCCQNEMTLERTPETSPRQTRWEPL